MDFKGLMANVGLAEESGDPSSMRIMCYGIVACMMFVYIWETITQHKSDLSIQEIITIALALGGKTAQKFIEVKKNGNNKTTTTPTPTPPQ